MEEKKKVPERLPFNWDSMYHFEQVCWFGDNFGTDKDDEEGNLIYDTSKMSEEIKTAYEEVIEGKKKAFKNGILFD